jgi:hypothetical protein
MYMSLVNSRMHGFKKFWDAHRPGNDDDDGSGGATPIALAEPCDDGEVTKEPPHRPWLVPGVGTSF